MSRPGWVVGDSSRVALPAHGAGRVAHGTPGGGATARLSEMVGARPTCANGVTPKSFTLVPVDANAKVYGLMDLSPEQMVSYMPAEDEQEYVENLVNKSKDGTLTEIEKAELDYFVQMEHLLQMMRSRAAKILATRHAA